MFYKSIFVLGLLLATAYNPNVEAKQIPDFTTGSSTSKTSDWALKLCPYCGKNYKDYTIKTEIQHIIKIEVEGETSFETCWTDIIRILKVVGINSTSIP